MRKIATIAFREFLETVRTKTFFFSVVLMPMLIMAFVFGAQWIGRVAEQERMEPRRIALLDETGLLTKALEEQVHQYNETNPNRVFELVNMPADSDTDALASEVRRGDLYAYLKIPANMLDVVVVEGEGGFSPDLTLPQPLPKREESTVGRPAACQLARRDQQLQAGLTLEQMVNAAVFAARCQEANPPVDPAEIAALQRKVAMEAIDVETGTVSPDNAFVRLITPFAIMFLLFMGTMQISYGLLTSVIEEKSSRVVEVLLSAVSPVQLMAGKIIGMVAVGGLLLCVWGGVGLATAHARGYGDLVSGTVLIYAILYFVPGFLLLSAILGAIGSACNTLKEAQSMASPITILNIVPMVLWYQISQNPGSVYNVVLSYIPPITPFIMILRICADPHTPMWQIVTTLALLWASVLATIWAAGKIFRIGVLMYGKPPSLGELLRWLRYA